MKQIRAIFLIFLVVLQISCNTKSEIKAYDFNAVLKTNVMLAAKSVAPIKVALCNEIPFDWDNIVILPPYSNAEIVRKHHLINSNDIEKKLPNLTLNEGICVLLFIKNNKIVRYSYVPRNLVDFNNIKSSNHIIDKISKNIVCEKLYLKFDKNSFSLFY